MKNIIELLKKNIAIAICLIVAIGAVVADFIPLGGFREQLKTEAEERSQNYAAIDKLLTQQRTLPNFNPGAAEAAPLDTFPTQAIIDRGSKVSQDFIGAANQLMDAASALNEKKPLAEGALPSGDFAAMEAFKDRYKRAVDMGTDSRRASMPMVIMNAGFAPTQDDLNKESERVRNEVIEQVSVRVNNQIENPQDVELAVNQALSKLQETIVKRVAETCKVYIGADTMQVDPNIISSPTQLAATTAFSAQVVLWAQEDLFNAIKDINATATNVSESPIKHLLTVRVTSAFVGIGAVSSDPNAPPSTPSSDPNAALIANYKVSPSGRVSNGVFDVFHLDVSMIVDAEKLPMVLNQFGKGRMLTVLQVKNLTPADPAVYANSGYFYGDKPVVQVDLLMEDLMFRKWTEKYMPETIKKWLGIQPAGGEATPPPG